MGSFFVTGTDTNVGKTIISRALIQAINKQGIPVSVFKPIACGDEDNNLDQLKNMKCLKHDNSDIRVLHETVSSDQINPPIKIGEINSYCFRLKSAPLFAALNELKEINISKIDADYEHVKKISPNLLVEGTFGWFTPINQKLDFSNWVAQNKLPVILVIGIKDGCMNHALLTAQAIKLSGCNLIGWVANRINPGLAHYAQIIEYLAENIKAPLLGKIPYIYHPEKQDLSNYITNIKPLINILDK